MDKAPRRLIALALNVAFCAAMCAWSFYWYMRSVTCASYLYMWLYGILTVINVANIVVCVNTIALWLNMMKLRKRLRLPPC